MNPIKQLEIEIYLHYNFQVCLMYQYVHNDRKAFITHMEMLIPPDRIEPKMDWELYHMEMLFIRDKLYKLQAMTYAVMRRKPSYYQIRKIVGEDSKWIKEAEELNIEASLDFLPPSADWHIQLEQVLPYWDRLKLYGFTLW